MRPDELTDRLFEREIRALLTSIISWSNRLDKVGPYINVKQKAFANNGPVSCPLASELWGCWEYARGTGAKPENMKDIIQSLLELLWEPVAAHSYEIPASWWETPLGTMVQLCKAREKFDAGVPLNAGETGLIVGLKGSRIRQMCIQGKIKASKEKRKKSSQAQWIIPQEEVEKLKSTTPN
ncbi:MAG: hypothetical protein NUV48_14100 [Peptococcaceae bacterium]|jgi:hypothetical protein|nr:hypothetical protein [Peptococcaceae bacterium]